MRRYPPSPIHRYLDLRSTQRIQAHTDITPPHHSRPWSKPLTHSPPTPPTPPQPKHRHTSNTTPVPTALVKPKPNPLIHSPPFPPTPLRVIHIHISHTPPTPHIPLTTLIHYTSAALNRMPEPRVPLTCPALTTPQLRTITLCQQTHMQHK